MLIKKIRLVNFKNFEDVTVELNDFNVLVGANAAGKTNFIQALRFLRDIHLFGLESAVQLQGGIEYLRNTSINDNKNTIVEYYFEKVDIGDKLNTILRKFFEINLESYKLELNSHNQKLTIVKEVINGGEYNPPNNEYPLELGLCSGHFFTFPEAFDYKIYDFDLKKAKQPATITGKVELEENAENLAIVLKKILEDDEKLQRFINILKDTLSYIDDVNINKFDKNLLLSVKEVYNLGTPMPSSLLSDGTISIVAMIIALFFENKPMAIFEEPEKGIHPALIGKLVNLFYDASRNKQVFITTHNPEILKYTQLNDLLLISRNDRGFSEISKPAEKEMVKSFLANELGIDQLFTQNLLEI